MSTNSLPSQNTTISDSSSSLSESPDMLLPRQAWNSQLTYLRVIFKAKKALDRIEQEAGIRLPANLGL